MKKGIIFLAMGLILSAAAPPPVSAQGDFIFELYAGGFLYPEAVDEYVAANRSRFDRSFFSCVQNLQQTFHRLEREKNQECEMWRLQGEYEWYNQCRQENPFAGVAGIIADIERLANGTPWLSTTSGQNAQMLMNMLRTQYQQYQAEYYQLLVSIYGQETADQLMKEYEDKILGTLVSGLKEVQPYFNCQGL